MWPWTHLALSYLLVSLSWRLRGNRVDWRVVLALGVGSQFPDLVDKPLAWYFGVIPAGRSLTHSALTATTVSVVVLAVAAQRSRFESGLAFGVAYGGHLLGDALPKLLGGEYESLTFLLWPLLPLPTYEGAEPVMENLGDVVAAPVPYLLASPVRAAILLLVALVWCADGFPGVADAGRYLARTRQE